MLQCAYGPDVGKQAVKRSLDNPDKLEMTDAFVHVDKFEVPPMRQIAGRGQSTLFC